MHLVYTLFENNYHKNVFVSANFVSEAITFRVSLLPLECVRSRTHPRGVFWCWGMLSIETVRCGRAPLALGGTKSGFSVAETLACSFAPTGEKSQQGIVVYHGITSSQRKGGNLVQWRSSRQDLIAKSTQGSFLRIEFWPPPPALDFLSQDFCLQPRLEWKFLLRRTWSGQKLLLLQFPGSSPQQSRLPGTPTCLKLGYPAAPKFLKH